MLKRTPLKIKRATPLKQAPLKSRKDYKGLKSNSVHLKQTVLKKQSDEAKERWEKARNECIIRDKGKCQICGGVGTQVHHIHLRSKRNDLLYYLPNLILLCDKHHFHCGSEKYIEQTKLIADSKNITVEELLKQAES